MYLLVGMICLLTGLLAGGLNRMAAEPMPSPFASVTWQEWQDAVTSINRWRDLAVRQQAEIRVRDFADELYPHLVNKLERIESLQKELLNSQNSFTDSFSEVAKLRMITACMRLLQPPFQIDGAVPPESGAATQKAEMN